MTGYVQLNGYRPFPLVASIILAVLLVVNVVFCAVGVSDDLARMDGNPFPMSEAGFEACRVLFMFLTGIWFAVWIGVARAKLHAGRQGATPLAPLLAGASALVPVAGLVTPPLVMRDALNAIPDDSSSAPPRRASVMVAIWWALWVLTCVGFICPFIGPATPGSGQVKMQVDAKAYLLWHVVTALAAIAGTVAVLMLTSLQSSGRRES